MSKNYYDVLSLKKDCSPQDIAQSYQKMVLRWHPKFAKEDQKTAQHYFSQISQAYEVLSDPIKRSFYDKYGWQKLKEGLFADGQLKGGYRFGNNPDEIFEKFFQSNNAFAKVFDKQVIEKGSLFSNAFGSLNYKQQVEINDLIVPVQCTLNQLYQGCAKRVTYDRKVLNPDGRTTCLRSQTRNLEIKPGYGIETTIKFPGQGHQTVHRTKSTLIFKIQQAQNKQYSRAGNDLIYTTDVSLAGALESKLIEIMTLDNRKLRVSIDEIITPQTVRQVVGEGMPIINSKQKGNLYIRFNIIFPKSLDQNIKQQISKLLG